MSTLSIKNIEHRTGGTISLDDSITLASGKKFTATDAGAIYSPGQIVQIGHQNGWTYQGTEGTTVNNTTGKLIEVVLTLKTTNPIIRARYNVPVGIASSYSDVDIALGFGIRNAAVDSTVGNYANWGGIARNRHSIAFSDGGRAHYVTDTQGAAGSGSQYWQEIISHEYQAAVTMNAGTYCSVALWCSTDGLYSFFRPYNHTSGDSGSQGSMTLEEIAQ